MRKYTGFALAFLSGCALLSAAPAMAATGLGLGIHGGYGETKDAESGSALAGAHVLIKPAGWLGVVGMIDYKFEEDFGTGDTEFQMKSYPITAMGRFYLPIQGFSPYVAAGVQYRIVSYSGNLFEDGEFDDSDAAFGWVAGAGAEIGAGKSVGLFGELRYESSDPDKDIENALEDAENLTYDQWTARAGITFFLN